MRPRSRSNVELRGGQDGRGGGVGCSCGFSAQEQQAISDGGKRREQIGERFEILELFFFELTARLDGFEVFFDGPARPIVIDDRELLLGGFDRLRRVQEPFDGLRTCRWIRFPDSHHVDGDGRC